MPSALQPEGPQHKIFTNLKLVTGVENEVITDGTIWVDADPNGTPGTLEDGKQADLMVVDGDPTQDIRILQDHSKLLGLMQGGQLTLAERMQSSTRRAQAAALLKPSSDAQ